MLSGIEYGVATIVKVIVIEPEFGMGCLLVVVPVSLEKAVILSAFWILRRRQWNDLDPPRRASTTLANIYQLNEAQ